MLGRKNGIVLKRFYCISNLLEARSISFCSTPMHTIQPNRNPIKRTVVHHPSPHTHAQVSFCLMKKARRCDNCHAQVTPSTASWSSVQRTTRAFVDSD